MFLLLAEQRKRDLRNEGPKPAFPQGRVGSRTELVKMSKFPAEMMALTNPRVLSVLRFKVMLKVMRSKGITIVHCFKTAELL